MPFQQGLPENHPLGSGDAMTDADIESVKPLSKEEIAESLNLDRTASWADIKAYINERAIEEGEKQMGKNMGSTGDLLN